MKNILIALCLMLTLQAKSQKISIIENVKIPDTDSVSLIYEFRILIPGSLQSIPNKQKVLNSFIPLFPGLDRLEGDYIVFRLSQNFNIAANIPFIKLFLQDKYATYESDLNALVIPPVDYLNGMIFDGNNWE